MALVLGFLQDRFSAGLTPSTLKVYVAAVAEFHAPLDGSSLGRHNLITHFLCGTLRMRPTAQVRIPTWDRTVVLERLSLAPFKPLDSGSDKCLAFKNGISVDNDVSQESRRPIGLVHCSFLFGVCSRWIEGDSLPETGLCT